MNVRITKAYTITLSELEVFALHKFTAHSSFNDRKKLGLSDDENDAISKLYGDIDAVISSE